MVQPERSQKMSLECLRLESACKELAAGVRIPALQLHFTRMAQVWNGLAETGLAEGIVERAPAFGTQAA